MVMVSSRSEKPFCLRNAIDQASEASLVNLPADFFRIPANPHALGAKPVLLAGNMVCTPQWSAAILRS